MIEIITKIAFTVFVSALFFVSINYIWTQNIDVYRTLTKPIAAIMETNKYSSIQFEPNNILLMRYMQPSTGQLVLAFYNSIRFVNQTDKAITIKNVRLSFDLNGTNKYVDLSELKIGRADTPDGPTDAAIFYKANGNSVDLGVMLRWRDFRMEIAEEKPIVPGAVLSGSGVFRLGIYDLEEFKKIASFKLTITDYSGNETEENISPQTIWMTEARTAFFDDRRFTIDASGKPTS